MPARHLPAWRRGVRRALGEDVGTGGDMGEKSGVDGEGRLDYVTGRTRRAVRFVARGNVE
jgi:hypothetical protein